MRIVLAMMMAIVATPVVAQTQPAGDTAKKARLICQREEKTGSRLAGGRKVCHTEEEWKALEKSDGFSRKATGASDLFRRAGPDQ